MKSICCGVGLMLLSLVLAGCGGGGSGRGWSAVTHGTVVEIGYGKDGNFPQYAALHLESGYFRMNYGPGSGWGTSVVLMPSFWSGGAYYQGTPITRSFRLDGDDLVIAIAGDRQGLHTSGEIRLSPPAGNALHAHVSMQTTGDVVLDNRPGEAFKPVMLSSMHISATQWDAQSAYIGTQTFALPANGWVVTPPVSGSVFGLAGGSSDWKANAPTVEITFATPQTITGWVTDSSNPNDDNIGFWAASDQVLAAWEYDIDVRQAE